MATLRSLIEAVMGMKGKVNAFDERIPDIGEPWEFKNADDGKLYGFTGARVHEALANAFSKLSERATSLETVAQDMQSGKVGYLCFSDDMDSLNFYHLWGFASEADAEKYKADPEGNASLRLFDQQLKILGIQGDKYVSYLYADTASTTDYIVSGDKFEVGLRFCAVKVSDGEQQNAGEAGTLTIERSLDGGASWTAVETRKGVLTSSEPKAEDFTKVDIGGTLSSGSQKIRLRATFPYTDTDGSQKTASSTLVQIGNTINKTDISIALSSEHQPYTPIWVSQLGASGARKFPLSYVCNGNVPKTLHYTIYDGSGEQVISGTQSGITTNGGTLSLNVGNETDNAGLFTHGVKTVLAYLTADDGMGGTIYSNGIVSRFMVVNEDDAKAKGTTDSRYFLLQQSIPAAAMDGKSDGERLQYFPVFANYTEGTLFDYAIFVPKTDESGNIILDTETKVAMTFYLSNYLSGTWSPTADGVTLYVEQQENVTASQTELQHFIPSVEIDSTSKSLYAYLHVWFGGEGGDEADFMQHSFGVRQYSIEIDNSESFAPVSGVTFQINPRTRNNSEDNPARILNSADNNSEVESAFSGFDFQTDGWITEDNKKLLRIPSGRQINIRQNPFAQFRVNPKSSLLMEMEFVVKNVTNEDDPILKIGEEVSGLFRGLRIYPLKGEMWVKSYGKHTDDIDFGWREGEKVHLTIAFCANVNPVKYGIKYGTADVHVPDTSSQYYKNPDTTTEGLVKVFINGNKQREVHFNTEDADEFCTGAMSNGGMYIGMSGADIDIYSFRMYANKEFSDDDVLTNYISSLSTTAEKKALSSANDIMTDEVGKSGKVVSIDKVQAKGKNTLLWHGQETSFLQDANLNGWVELKKYDSNGNYQPKYSGSLCRTTGMEILSGNISEWNSQLSAKEFPFVKGQGSSAKTYWDWNQQFDMSKFKSVIRISRDKFDSSITISDVKTLDDGSTVVEIYGGNLGADFPLGNTPKQYPIDTETGLIEVPDGWIDGNGILIGDTGTVWHSNGDEDTVEGTGYYRGPCYQVAAGTPLVQKTVWKINYASCQQSHLTGVNNIYNDIHTAIVGQNDLQKEAAKIGNNVRVSKYTEPFFYFIKYDDNSDVLYRGGCTFGGGKMDKSTWGYAKKYKGLKDIKKFCMFEGSDNSLTGTDFRVPFTWKPEGDCADAVTYDTKGEGFGVTEGSGTDRKFSQCWDFDGGATYDEADELADATHKADYPKEDIIALFAAFANFVYLHNPAIKAYTQGDGTFDTFKTSEQGKDYYTKYWMTQGDDKYRLYRYSFGAEAWVDAGLWTQLEDGTYGWEPVYVNSSEPFKYTAEEYATKLAAEPDEYNTKIVEGVIADFKARLPLYMDPKSLQVYYALEVHFFCGTDNCGKNTYIVLSQFDRTVDITLPDGTKETHEGVCRFEMHSDDVDTTMAIDNNGRVTHDYDVDRQHPYNKDDATTTATYSGMNNVLFNLCEQSWDTSTDNTLRTVMGDIFTEMCSLASVSDVIPGFPYNAESQPSVLGALFKYIFYVESYFPARAYNEQGRIRYEYPETLGFITARQVKPIWQSQGNMDQYELEFMYRRIVYMITYAAWGPASNVKRLTGIPDADEGEFAMTGTSYPDSTQRVHVAVTLTAHQTLYPTGNVSGAAGTTIDPHHRMRAGEKYTLSLGDNTFEKDTYFCIYMRNFYRSFGNLADISMKTAFILNGTRLTEFVLDPDSVTHYTDTEKGSVTQGESIAPFRPEGFSIGTARNLQKLDIHGIKSINGDLNLQSLSRLESFSDKGTQVATVELPETRSLTTVEYSDTITNVTLPSQGGLTTLTAEGYSNIKTMLFGRNTPGKTVVPFLSLCASNAPQDMSITVDRVQWETAFVITVLEWILGKEFTAKTSGSTGNVVTVSDTLTSGDVKTITDALGDGCFNEGALPVYVKSGGGVFLTGPDTVASGKEGDFKLTIIPKGDYTPSYRIEGYERTTTDADGNTVYHKGVSSLNGKTGHLTTEVTTVDESITILGYYSDESYLNLPVTIRRTTYPSDIQSISGPSEISAEGSYDYTARLNDFTGDVEYKWSLSNTGTLGLTLTEDGTACTVNCSGSLPQTPQTVKLTLTLTCANGTVLTKDKNISVGAPQGKVIFNPSTGTCALERKNLSVLQSALDAYVNAMKFYVFSSDGTQMAEIESATFVGDYTSGMKSGSVTFKDGQGVDIATLNAKGCNFMAWRPQMYFRSYVDADNAAETAVFGGLTPVSGGESFAGKYIGMFKGYVQDSVLKSQPGRVPTGNMTIGNFQGAAQSGGTGYGLWNYHDWCKENLLHISRYGNTNYEQNVGTGRINNYDKVRNIVTGYTLPRISNSDHGTGKEACLDSDGNTVYALNFFGLEGLGEQIWEFVIGYRCDETTQYIWDANEWSEAHDADYTLVRTISSATQDYISQIIGGTHFDMMPRAVGASSVSGWCDGTWAATTGRVLCVGGAAAYGSICGLSASASDNGFSSSGATIGARLAFYGRPSEVTGTEFVAALKS